MNDVKRLIFLYETRKLPVLYRARSLAEKVTNIQLIKIFWNREIHCRVHINTPLGRILNYMHPTHTHASYFLSTNFNIIAPSTFPKWFSPLRFADKKVFMHLSYPIRATGTAHLILLHLLLHPCQVQLFAASSFQVTLSSHSSLRMRHQAMLP
jgi:hypothetical protein